MKHGRGADLDTIAAILAGRTEWSNDSIYCWTRTKVHSVVWGHSSNWCSINSVIAPINRWEQMWIYLDFLVDTDLLDDSSDPLNTLREPLRCYGWLDKNGVTRTDNGARDVPCRCHKPYKGKPHGYYKLRRSA